MRKTIAANRPTPLSAPALLRPLAGADCQRPLACRAASLTAARARWPSPSSTTSVSRKRPSALGKAGAKVGGGIPPEGAMHAAKEPARLRTPVSAAAPMGGIGDEESGHQSTSRARHPRAVRCEGEVVSGVPPRPLAKAASAGNPRPAQHPRRETPYTRPGGVSRLAFRLSPGPGMRTAGSRGIQRARGSERVEPTVEGGFPRWGALPPSLGDARARPPNQARLVQAPRDHQVVVMPRGPTRGSR